MKKYLLAVGILSVVTAFFGCRKSESRDEMLNRSISGSPVIFLVEPGENAFVVTKIYRLEPSWGSDIRVGENLTIRADPKVVRKPFLILRGLQQYLGKDLNQSQIPINAAGNLEYYEVPLREVERRILMDEGKARSTEGKISSTPAK